MAAAPKQLLTKSCLADLATVLTKQMSPDHAALFADEELEVFKELCVFWQDVFANSEEHCRILSKAVTALSLLRVHLRDHVPLEDIQYDPLSRYVSDSSVENMQVKLTKYSVGLLDQKRSETVAHTAFIYYIDDDLKNSEAWAEESFNFMKSSSIVSKKPPLLEKALSLAPAELIRRLSALLEGCDDKKRPSGAWKRKIQSILEPTRECYEALCVEDVNGGSVRFSCGLLSHMLAYICDACSWYQQRFAIISDRPVGLLLFGDEATGGNVLCTASSKKMWLFHLAFPQLGELHRPDSWLPLAAIPHRDVVNVKGGLSRCIYIAFFEKAAGERSAPMWQEVHLELRHWRSGYGDAQKLDAAQRKHHQLFCTCYSGLERPKGHFRLHLPKMYERLGYADCFAGEAKHRLYKAYLADSHAGLWSEGSGKLSAHLCGRLLLKSCQQLKDSPWTHRLATPLHDSNSVLRETGLQDCSISRGYHLGSLLLEPGMPLIWNDNIAGCTQFFADQRGNAYMIYEELTEMPTKIRFSRTFRLTGVKKAVLLKHIQPDVMIADIIGGAMGGSEAPQLRKRLGLRVDDEARVSDVRETVNLIAEKVVDRIPNGMDAVNLAMQAAAGAVQASMFPTSDHPGKNRDAERGASEKTAPTLPEVAGEFFNQLGERAAVRTLKALANWIGEDEGDASRANPSAKTSRS
eukprot:s697_g12.t1